jgi:flagellar hook protein FlgE
MTGGISSSLTALTAFGTKLHVTANNVANANTKGFKYSRVTPVEGVPQGVRAVVERIGSPGPQVPVESSQGPAIEELSTVDLGQEMADMILSQRAFEANVHALRTQDEAVGTLLDIIR